MEKKAGISSVLILAALLCAGCNTKKQDVFLDVVKPNGVGRDSVAMGTDGAACSFATNAQSPATDADWSTQYRHCMRARGWQFVREERVPIAPKT